MASNNLNVLMQKLYTMEKVVGGGKGGAQGGANSSGDEFNTIKQTLGESLSAARKKLDEKDEKVRKFGNSPDVLKMGNEIKDRVQSLDKQLSQMNEILRKQKRDRKRYGVSELEIKEKQYNTLLTQVKEVKARERGLGSVAETQMRRMSEIKSDLMGKGSIEMKAPEREMNAEEASALDRWAENDKKQDDMLDIINSGLENLKGKAQNIGHAGDKVSGMIDVLDTELDVAYKELESSNSSLKKVLVEYRKPSKFCMDICLLFVLIGLIGVIVKIV